MSNIHRLLTGIGTLALVAAFSTTGFAAKAVIDDEELDQVTAAGQPKIVLADGKAKGDVYAKNDQEFQVNGVLKSQSQNELKAITLNNIFGENQVANGVNIQAATGMAEGSAQSNDILQSWGSAQASAGKKVDGVASSGDNNSRIAQANAQAQAQTAGEKLIAVDQAQANAQDAEVRQTQNHAAAQGVLSVLWSFADEIAMAKGYAGEDLKAKNKVETHITGVIEGGAQSNLSALTVNNVFGMNQVANALNVASGNIGFNPLDIAASGSTSAASQANNISQYRGAPAGWNSAPVFSN